MKFTPQDLILRLNNKIFFKNTNYDESYHKCVINVMTS